MPEQHIPHILIVEDYPDMRTLLAAYVHRDFTPAQVHEAATVAEAQAILDAHPIDIMLLDCRLADSTGYKDVRKLLASSPQVATAIVTGYPRKADHDQALADGAKAYYDKFELIDKWREIKLIQQLLADVRGTDDGGIPNSSPQRSP